MPPSRRRADRPRARTRKPRRRVLRLGAGALAGSLAGCLSGALDESSDATTEGDATDEGGVTNATTEQTTLPMGVDSSIPEGSASLPAGPKSRPERPSDLTAESVREYVRTFEYRYVYNELHADETTAVDVECGVESVEANGDWFRAVAWCSGYANAERDGETVHADAFAEYATYFVGPDSTVRREGRSRPRG